MKQLELKHLQARSLICFRGDQSITEVIDQTAEGSIRLQSESRFYTRTVRTTVSITSLDVK